MERTSKELVSRAEWNTNGVSVSVALDGRTYPVRFAVSGEGLGMETDFLLPLTLFPAMVTGSRLKLPGEASPHLLSAVPKIQDIFRLWGAEHWDKKFQDLQRIPVDAEIRGETTNHASGVACFFSGGVDSFYTLLKHRDEITHLIFVHGFDIPLADQSLRTQASRMAREVAGELGKTLIEVETNLRSFSDASVGWDKYHGSALASVALLFQHRFRRVLIASTRSYAGLVPWGSHPALDPLWSTELTTIEHDGCETTRPEKVDYISEHQLVMKWLRVCLYPEGAYNCGHCIKCLTTMLSLQAAGALERCKTLPNDLNLQAVADMDLSEDTLWPLAQQILRALERRGTKPEVVEALAEAIAKCPETSEARAERTERHRLEVRLERTRDKQKARKNIVSRLRAENKRLKAENKRLKAENKRHVWRNLRQAAARYFSRRYKLLGAPVKSAPRIQKAEKSGAEDGK